MEHPEVQSKRKELLGTPISLLGLSVVGSLLEEPLRKLYRELDEVGIRFRPHAYLSDDWGCPDGVPIIGIPFYLASEDLRELEREHIGSVETEDDIARILRHEAGHAFNYAYELWKLPRWKEIFGIFETPYRDNFAPFAGSDKFVRHLEGWYAQKHPDEDFAETCAVVMAPDSPWRTEYAGTEAFRKLEYVTLLISEYGNRPPLPFRSWLDVPAESLGATVGEWYAARQAAERRLPKILALLDPARPSRSDDAIDELLSLGYSVVLLPADVSPERLRSEIDSERPSLVAGFGGVASAILNLLKELHAPFVDLSAPQGLPLARSVADTLAQREV